MQKKEEKHHIDIAKEKYLKGEDITVGMVIKNDSFCGVVYKGAVYYDCYLEHLENKAVGLIEIDDFLHIFNCYGSFIIAYRMDKFIYGKKEYIKTLKKVLKGIK